MNTTQNKSTKQLKSKSTQYKGKHLKTVLTKENNFVCSCKTHYGIYYRTPMTKKFNKLNFQNLSDDEDTMMNTNHGKPSISMTFSTPISFPS